MHGLCADYAWFEYTVCVHDLCRFVIGVRVGCDSLCAWFVCSVCTVCVHGLRRFVIGGL